MAVANQTPYKEYVGNGTTTIFPLEFDCDDAEHLIVKVNDIEVPALNNWSLNTNTGSVVFAIAPINESKIILQRDTPLVRDTDYQTYNNSLRPQPVNNDFDKIWLKLQELGVTNWLTDSDIKNLNVYVNSLNEETRDDFFNKLGNLEQNTNAMLEEAIKNGAVSALAITTVNTVAELNALSKWDGRTVAVSGIGNYKYNGTTQAWERDFITDRQIVNVESYSSLLDLPKWDGRTVYVKSYYAGLGAGGANYTFNQSQNKWILQHNGFVTPTMFGAIGNGIDDDRLALTATDTFATANNIYIDGLKKFYAISQTITLNCADLLDLNIKPHANFSGSNVGVIAYVNQQTGKFKIQGGSVKGFGYVGVNLLRGTYASIPTSSLKNFDGSNNGGLKRTTLTVAAMANSLTQTVKNSSIFSISQIVWIGDCQLQIAGILGNVITMLSDDGLNAKVLNGGSVTMMPVGQYFTLDRDGAAGLKYGSGLEETWNNDIDDCDFNDCGWFGIFGWTQNAPTQNQMFKIKNSRATGCGFIGMGLGRIFDIDARNNNTSKCGNNGIDINQIYGSSGFDFNTSENCGVDGFFFGIRDKGIKFTNNRAKNNIRLGVLLSSPNSYVSTDNYIAGNTLEANGLAGITTTGVTGGIIMGNTFDGITRKHLFIEGYDNAPNPDGWIVSNNTFKSQSTLFDINANMGGYTNGGANGSIQLADNNYPVGVKPKIAIYNFNRTGSKFSPKNFISIATSLTAAAAAAINYSPIAYKAWNTSDVDVTAAITSVKLFSDSSLSTPTNVNVATINAGGAIYNTLTAAAGTAAMMCQWGTFTISLVSNTAATKYIQLNIDGKDYVTTATWS